MGKKAGLDISKYLLKQTQIRRVTGERKFGA